MSTKESKKASSASDAADVAAIQALANSDATTQEAAATHGAGQLAAQVLQGARPALRVVSRPETFRRVGRQFGRDPHTIPLDELQPWQVEALEKDPDLVVTRVLLPAEPEAAAE